MGKAVLVDTAQPIERLAIGSGDTAEATIDKAAASNAITAGNIGALSSILGASTSVASKWSQANTLGMGTDSSSGVGTFSNGGNDGAAPTWGS